MTVFQKPALTIDQQIAHLQGQGMAIPDAPRACHYLRAIGYYRLSGYAYPFRANPAPAGAQRFVPGTDFETVLDRYICDREMRLLAMDAIERVEVGVRTAISNHMSCAHGPHWYTDQNLFLKTPVAKFNHSDFLRLAGRECAKSAETFIRHYLATYTQPPLPPSWMIMETLSLGTIAKLFDNLPRADRVAIAGAIRIDGTQPLSEKIIGSWLNSLTELRNACAHHARLLLRAFMISAIEPKAFVGSFHDPRSFYPRALMLHLLLRALAPASHWTATLLALLGRHPNVDPGLYGFPPGWQTQSAWQPGAFTWPAK